MKTIVRRGFFAVLVSVFMFSVGFIPIRNGFAEEVIAPLAAVRNGLKVADDMIVQGKLDADWATGLRSVSVTMRNIKGFAEYVVTLTRSRGTPANVSIYINMSGGYSGSSLGDRATPSQ